MKIEIWSDVVCPWCYVGKRRLEQALGTFPHASEVEIEWKSFELDPDAPPERSGTYVERLATRYGISEEDARDRIQRMVDVGADLGIKFRFDIARPGNTFDAHRLLHLAKSVGLQNHVEERFFVATFTDGYPIADREALLKLAADGGLAEADARLVLESDEYADAVRRDEAEAMALGVRAVPFFVLDRRYAVAGAQPPHVLLDVLEQTWREVKPVKVIGDEGELCDGENCELY